MSRVNEAYNRIRTNILTNQFPAGSVALEPDLATDLGMSRTPVREALIKLESDGLVELIPRRGARVLPIAPDDMREIYDIFGLLEPEVAANVASKKLSGEQLEPLVLATAEMGKAIKKRDLDAWAAADDRFHRYLVSLHHNGRIRSFLNTLFDQVHRARIMTLHLRELPQRSTDEHQQILESIVNADAKKARALFRAHRKQASSELLTILEKLRMIQV